MEPTIKTIEALLPVVVLLIFLWIIFWLLDRF